MGARAPKSTGSITVSEITKSVPLPDTAHPRESRYPVAKLTEVGQSFFATGGRPTGMASTIYDIARKLKIPVHVRTVVENETAGVRVWRVAEFTKRGRKQRAAAT